MCHYAHTSALCDHRTGTAQTRVLTVTLCSQRLLPDQRDPGEPAGLERAAADHVVRLRRRVTLYHPGTHEQGGRIQCSPVTSAFRAAATPCGASVFRLCSYGLGSDNRLPGAGARPLPWVGCVSPAMVGPRFALLLDTTTTWSSPPGSGRRARAAVISVPRVCPCVAAGHALARM